MKSSRTLLFRDLAIVVLSICFAIALVATGALGYLFAVSKIAGWLGSFVAGLFFTSIFTTAPAIVALAESARATSVLHTALFGAVGAVLGDLVIFRFIRDHISAHLVALAGHSRGIRRAKYLLRAKAFRWFTFLVAGLIIASPVPDEVGISLLGFTRLKTRFFIPLSFTFNFIGIYIIGTVARSIQ